MIDSSPENNAEQRIAFPRLDENDIAELEEIGSRRHLQDREVLFEAGDAAVSLSSCPGRSRSWMGPATLHMTVVLRGSELHASMSSYLADRIEAAENVKVRYHSQIRRLSGEDRLAAVEIEDTETGATEMVETPAVFSFIGAVPCTKWLPTEIETDANGFICTGRDVTAFSSHSSKRCPQRPALPMETSYPGVFAAGDVRAGSTKRVSSAVGEGAMAIHHVHAYQAEQEAWRPE